MCSDRIVMFLTVDSIEFQADRVTSSEKSTAVDNSKELASPAQVDPQECVAGESTIAAREAVSEAKPDVAPETSVATPIAEGKSLSHMYKCLILRHMYICICGDFFSVYALVLFVHFENVKFMLEGLCYSL